MSFLPAIPLPCLKSKAGEGRIASNIDGTLLASVVSDQHCVYIYSVDSAGECSIVGTVGTPGIPGGGLDYPTFACLFIVVVWKAC